MTEKGKIILSLNIWLMGENKRLQKVAKVEPLAHARKRGPPSPLDPWPKQSCNCLVQYHLCRALLGFNFNAKYLKTTQTAKCQSTVGWVTFQTIIERFLPINWGVGIAHFNFATPGSPTVNSVRIAVLFEKKVHFKLFKEGCKGCTPMDFWLK